MCIRDRYGIFYLQQFLLGVIEKHKSGKSFLTYMQSMNILSKYWIITLVLLHVLAVWASVGHYHDDEYFQILDFAALKLGFVMQDTVMWEYQAGIRSGFQPFIAYTIVKMLSFFNITSPFVWSFYLRLLTATLSLFSVIMFCQVAKRDINSTNICLLYTSDAADE